MSIGVKVLIIACNLPVYWLLARIFFEDREEFMESLRYWLTPDLVSAFRGEYWEDAMGEIKFLFWLLGCGVVVYGEMMLFGKLFG